MAASDLTIHITESFEVNKILIAAKYNGVTVHVKEVAEVKNHDNAVANPIGKFPEVLETPNGFLFGSNTIARYVSKINEKAHLFGRNNCSHECSLVGQWLEFAALDVDLPTRAWVLPILGKAPSDAETTNQARGDLRKALKILDDHLLHRTFLVGERVTLADIAVASSLVQPYTLVLDPGFRKQFGNANRWFQTCVNQPHFKEVLGEVVLATKMQKAPEPVKQEKPTPAPKQEKKQEKPKETPAASSEEHAEDEEPKKKKNPFEHLPPTKFDLREWKVQYSNSDTRTEALPWFWKKWEECGKDGWSLWFCNYKYNSELDVVFKTSNLVAGFLQRAEELRDYAFGPIVILGEPNNLEVVGAWLLRGHEIPQILQEVPDYAVYDWRQVDISKPEEKELLEDIWAWEGKFGGKTFQDGKTFK